MTSEVMWRLGCFFFVLLVVASIERFRPKRRLSAPITRRWRRNCALVVLNTLAVRLFVPFTAVSVALYASQNGIGLFQWLDWPFFLQLVVSMLVLDLVIYWQHVAFHRIPWLWRLHKIHHIDHDIDVTTGLRFHPVEILISALIKCAAVIIFGVPVFAVVLFEIVLNASAMFNHGNIRLPSWLDKGLRFIIVTPDMHRVHHSSIPKETDSNFGFNLPWWDYLFKTYRAQPKAGHDKMKIGLNAYPDEKHSSVLWLLRLPFR